MARYKPWLKMWVDFLNDPKIDRLTLAEQGAWWRLVAYTHMCCAEGRVETSSGSALSIHEIATNLKIVKEADLAILQTMIQKMTNEKSISREDATMILVNYAKRQKGASETADAVRQRVRAWRAKKRNAQQPLPMLAKKREPEKKEDRDNIYKESDQDVTSLQPVTSSEREDKPFRDHGNEKSVTPVTGKIVTSPLHSVTSPLQPGSPVTGNPLQEDPLIGEISRLHTENFGDLKPLLADDIREFCETCRVPVPWVALAFKAALGQNKRKWSYVRAILEDWREKGAPDERYQRQTRPARSSGAACPAAAVRSDTAGRDPIADARAEGWHVISEDDDEAGSQA